MAQRTQFPDFWKQMNIQRHITMRKPGRWSWLKYTDCKYFLIQRALFFSANGKNIIFCRKQQALETILLIRAWSTSQNFQSNWAVRRVHPLMSEPEMYPVAILFGTDVIQNVVPVSVGFRETLKGAVLMKYWKILVLQKGKKMNCRFSQG